MKLKAQNITKAYGDNVILDGVSFAVNSGESLVLRAPSGAGKSTLLSIVGLLLEPSSGDVLLDEQVVSALPDKQASKLRLETFGFVFQHTQLVGSLRAIENVMVPANLAGMDAKAAESRALELLEQFGLAERAYHFPYQLSVGQKRRVALARALMLKPQIIIADEPTNDLDADSQASVADALFEHVEQGGLLVFATHDASLAERANNTLHLV